MADTKLSALTELAATPADDDELYIRDISEAAAAESKRITIANAVIAAVKAGVKLNELQNPDGTIDLNGQELQNASIISGRTSAGLIFKGLREDNDNNILIYSVGVSPGFSDTLRLIIGGRAAEATATWSNIIHSGLKLGGSVDLNGQAFDAGSGSADIRTTGSGKGLEIRSTQTGATGPILLGYHVNTSRAADNVVFTIQATGYDDADDPQDYCRIELQIEDPTAASPDGKMRWRNMSAGSWNTGMTLSGAGDLWIDKRLFQTTIVTNITTAGAATLSAAQMVGGMITRDPNGDNRTDTTDTAANIVAAIADAIVGTSFEFTIKNTADAAETITVAGGTNVTTSGTMTIAQNYTKRFMVVLTNVTGASEAATIYSLGTVVH